MGDYNTQVNIARAGFQSRLWGTVFFIEGRYDISVKWVGGRALHVVCATCDPAEVEQQRQQWRDVKIEYPEFGSIRNPDQTSNGVGSAKNHPASPMLVIVGASLLMNQATCVSLYRTQLLAFEPISEVIEAAWGPLVFVGLTKMLALGPAGIR